jgi:trans-aconitate methyltransferase
MVRGRTIAHRGQTLGHEITGEIIELGRDVQFLAKGDLVSVPFNIACERCRMCKAGHTGVCLNVNPTRPGAAYGYVDMGGWIGGQARYVMVPYADKTAFSSVTLTDLSEQMLEVSRQFNPDCEHLQGDMRTLRLERAFDAVFVHDAITYMTTLGDLKQAIETAFVHCKPGGMAIFVPDDVSETFEPSTDHGGSDGDGRSIRYLEWSYDPDETDTTIVTDYLFLLRDGEQPVQVEHDQHITGLFSREQWLSVLHDTGFRVSIVIDPFDRHVFVARKESSSGMEPMD